MMASFDGALASNMVESASRLRRGSVAMVMEDILDVAKISEVATCSMYEGGPWGKGGYHVIVDLRKIVSNFNRRSISVNTQPLPTLTMEMRALTHSLRLRPTVLRSTQPLALTLRHASSNTPSKTQPTQPTQGTSDFDQILSKLNISNTAASSEPSAPQQPGNASGSRQSVFGDALSLGRAVGMSAGTDNYRPAVRRVELKLGPSLGRQVHVEPEKGTDLAAALRTLQITCNANRVKQQANQQRFHVRRGQMRKDLRMQRWRKLFKFSFDKTVSKIQRMRAQGW
jgi:hypothetical protein